MGKGVAADRRRARRRARGDRRRPARERVTAACADQRHQLRARSRSAPTIRRSRRGSAAARRRARRGRSTTRRPARASSPPSRTPSRSKLGFSHANVKWVYTPFARSYAPGKKSFDFDINEISYTPARAKVVELQHVVLRRQPGGRRAQGNADRDASRSIAGLRTYKLGAQLGTTSYDVHRQARSSRRSSRRSTSRTSPRSPR